MGVAIAGMHYTAMGAAIFMPSGTVPDFDDSVSVTALGVAGMVVVSSDVARDCYPNLDGGSGLRSFEQLKALGSELAEAHTDITDRKKVEELIGKATRCGPGEYGEVGFPCHHEP